MKKLFFASIMMLASLTACQNESNEVPVMATSKANSEAKLNESQIAEIKNLFKQGVSRKNIASAFKIDYSQVCKIIKGSSWKHLHIPAGEFIDKSTLIK